MPLEKYCVVVVGNIEESLDKRGRRLPSKCVTSMASGYKPKIDVTTELKADEVQCFQEIIGQIRWYIELGRVNIFLEVSLLSQYLALPHEGHLEQTLHIIGYLKSHKKLRLLFDGTIPRIDE